MNYYFLISNRLKSLCKVVEDRFKSCPKPAYFDHSLRVANYCYQIGILENIDLEIIVAAALIHDIGRVTRPSFKEHVIGTKEEGYKILLACDFNETETNKIMQIALAHHPKNDEILSDIYEQILFDADALECVGVFGITRWYVNISNKLEDVIADANMYIDSFSFTKRKTFFYTKYACEKGEHLIKEGIEHARKMITFCEASIKQDDKLIPIGINDKVE